MKSLKNIGNIEGYNHEPRMSRFDGYLTMPDLTLKMYCMLAEGESSPVGAARKFITDKVAEREIDTFTGMGFAIISRNTLNVARWDKENPIVIRNQLYEFCPKLSEGVSSARLRSLDNLGPFCVWELGIVGHEKEAWKRYLTSNMTEGDKRTYLNDYFEGKL